MKKILLATTMLVGTAGFAAAEVSLSGNARMGIVNQNGKFNGEDLVENETSFNSRVRATVSMSGETDNGLSFGGSFGIHDADAAASGTAGSVYISGPFGKLSMGDTSSAAELAVGDLAGVGYTGHGAYSWDSTGAAEVIGTGNIAEGLALGNEMTFISTGDNEMALYQYEMGGLSIGVSVGQPSDGNDTHSIGVAYSNDTFAVGVGYEDVEDLGSQIIASASATVSDVTFKAVYGTIDGDNDSGEADQYGASASYTMDAITVSAFYRATDVTIADESADFDAYGVGVSYDLGGGAKLAGGVSRLNAKSGDDKGNATTADVGVTFSF